MAEIKMVLHEITLAKAMVWNTITGHPSTRSETRGKTNEFEGATCTACDSPLNRKGFCTNRRCGY